MSTGPDQVALHYSDGAFSARRFQDCVGSSSRAWDGPGDKHYSYPKSQRNYVFGEGGDRAPVIFVEQGRHRDVGRRGQAFLLNTDCGTLQKFHDLIGNRYAAYMDSTDGNGSAGWLTMLSVYISRPLGTAIDRASQKYTYTELYTDPAVKAQWEADVLAQMPDLVGRQIDGDRGVLHRLRHHPAEARAARVGQGGARRPAGIGREGEGQGSRGPGPGEGGRGAGRGREGRGGEDPERIKVLGRDGYLKQYAIDHGLNPYQPSTNGLITGP